MKVKFTKNEREMIRYLIIHYNEATNDPIMRVIIHKLKLWSEEEDEL